MTKVFVFLGNERLALANTRHNAGFIVGDVMAQRFGASEFQKVETAKGRYDYSFCVAEIDGEMVYLVKPLARNMEDVPGNPGFGHGDINSSGFGLTGFLRDHLPDAQPEIVVFGDAVVSTKNPEARYIITDRDTESHNGVKDIICEVPHGFTLIDLPIGKPKGQGQMVNHVIGEFTPEQREEIDIMGMMIADNIGDVMKGHYGTFNAKMSEGAKRLDKTYVATEKKLKDDQEKIVKNIKKENATLEKLQTSTDEKKDEYIATSQKRIVEYSTQLEVLQARNVSKAAIWNGMINEIAAMPSMEGELENLLTNSLENMTIEQQAEFLGAMLKESLGSRAPYSTTQTIINRMKPEHREIVGAEVLHHAVTDPIASQEKVNILMKAGFGEFVDVADEHGKSPLLKILENGAKSQKLPLQVFWQLYPHAQNLGNIEQCIKHAKSRETAFVLTPKDQASSAEIAKMLPHRLLKERRESITTGMKPTIFAPFIDHIWGPAPSQVLQDFGCEVARPTYDVADDQWFSSPEKLIELENRVRDHVRNSNGLVVFGNNGNIDPKFFDPAEKIDLSDFGQRRTFVEWVALQEAIAERKPMWTICGGTQMAITAFGGQVGPLKKDHLRRRGKEEDVMEVMPGSLLDLMMHTKNPAKRAAEQDLGKSRTWSAHGQGLLGDAPENMEIIAVSHSELNEQGEEVGRVPKAYHIKIKGDSKPLGIATQSHAEPDPSTNAQSRNLIHWFVKEARVNLKKSLESKLETSVGFESPASIVSMKSPHQDNAQEVSRTMYERLMDKIAGLGR